MHSNDLSRFIGDIHKLVSAAADIEAATRSTAPPHVHRQLRESLLAFRSWMTQDQYDTYTGVLPGPDEAVARSRRSLDALWGVAPDITGGRSSETWVRQIRSERGSVPQEGDMS